jgi:hypothetical protein
MKFGRILTLGAAFMWCGASAAFAGPKYIVTAPALRTVGTAQVIYCDIVNLDGVNQDVVIDVMDYNGNLVSSLLGGTPYTLAPNTGYYHPDYTGAGAWCRFTVNTSTKKFRAIAVYDAGPGFVGGTGDHYTMTIPGF